MGTGKFTVHYEQVFGRTYQAKGELDPTLSKLATGKLEVEIKADPEAGSVAATVNGEAIVAEEVYAAAYLSLPDAHTLTALERSRRITAVWRKTLDHVIERELIVQEARRALKAPNADVLNKLQEVAAKEFARQWVETVKKTTRLQDDKQLRAFLRAQGTSLEAVQRQWERAFIAEEYLRSRSVGVRDAEQAQKERARLISQLKQHAVIDFASGQ